MNNLELPHSGLRNVFFEMVLYLNGGSLAPEQG